MLACTVSVAAHAVSLQPAEQCSSPDTLCNGLQVGAKVMLGDRPVRVTLARCWAALSRWSRIRFIFSLLWGGLTMGGEDLKAQVEQMKASPSLGLAEVLLSAVQMLRVRMVAWRRPVRCNHPHRIQVLRMRPLEAWAPFVSCCKHGTPLIVPMVSLQNHKVSIGNVLQDSDVLTEALKEFADEFPQLMRPLIEERDEYMVFLLRTLAIRWSTLSLPLAVLLHASCCPSYRGIQDLK